MPKFGLAQKMLTRRKDATRYILVAMLLTGCAGYLGGCASSSSNTASMYNGRGGYASGYNNSETGGVPSTAFAATPAAEAAAKLTAASTPGNSAYKIGPLDVLEITVFKVPDLTKTVQVSDDGTINVPLVNNVPVAGKTAHEVERDLTQKLGAKYLRSPQVSIFVKEYNSQRVTVEGSVKTTGVYAIKGRTTLIQVIAISGGIDTTVASGDIVIFRTIDGKRSAARFDVDAIKKGEAEDPEIISGDVVVVDTSNTKVVLNNVLRVLPLATSAAMFVPMM
jgi:polysaccharide biosynthesis/export protein